ncbi:OPA3-like protein [Salvia miltiorrhiza]|uniref:OPA3-like protein n=1 Tax=Salvia miltiorrhiza TaxID=226208 RepID=UPI0025AC87A3|nr:OPA3-like protein [Salvia miltiorrhiza]
MLPLLKLGTLALKTLSKPIAAKLKKQAGIHPKFRNVIVSVAQANHRITTTMQRRIYGHATDVEIRPLNEEKAVQAAVDLMGELFVFSVAVAALIFEVQRSARSEAKKEEVRRQEMEGMRQRDEELAQEVELLKQKLAEIEQMAKVRGLAGVFNFRQAQAEEAKPSPVA